MLKPAFSKSGTIRSPMAIDPAVDPRENPKIPILPERPNPAPIARRVRTADFTLRAASGFVSYDLYVSLAPLTGLPFPQGQYFGWSAIAQAMPLAGAPSKNESSFDIGPPKNRLPESVSFPVTAGAPIMRLRRPARSGSCAAPTGSRQPLVTLFRRTGIGTGRNPRTPRAAPSRAGSRSLAPGGRSPRAPADGRRRAGRWRGRSSRPCRC